MSHKSLLTSIFGIAAVVVLSRGLGFVREMVIAREFGTSADYDLYLVGLMLPALAYGVVNFAALYLFVPFFSQKLAGSDLDSRAAWAGITPSINLILAGTAAVVALIVIVAPTIVPIWLADRSEAEIGQAIWYCRLIAPMVLLGTGEAIMRAYLNIRGVVNYPAAGYVIFNLCSIGAIVLLSGQYGVLSIAIGLLAGLLAQNLFLLARILPFGPWRGRSLALFDDSSRGLIAAAGMIILVELINRSYFLLDRYVAVQFGDGVIAALNYSQVLIQLPESVVGFAIGTVVFPILSRAAHNGGSGELARTFSSAVLASVALALPVAAVYFSNSNALVAVLFERGEFTSDSVALTARLLQPHSLSILSLFALTAALRACYAASLTRQVLIAAAAALIIKVVATFALADWIGMRGITTATSLSFATLAVWLSTIILRHGRHQREFSLGIELLKLTAAAAVALLVSAALPFDDWFSLKETNHQILRLVLPGTVILAVYALVSPLVLHRTALGALVALFRRGV